MSKAIWKSRPLFISSTFKDMQAERDYLHTKVFPNLSEKLLERYHYLEPIDLRWGIETSSVELAEEKEIKVLQVCFSEIERSNPFMIVLIGDRYGHVPDKQPNFPLLIEKGISINGKSVTALEIEYGALNEYISNDYCFFYFRKPLPYSQMSTKQAAKYSDLHDPRFVNNIQKLEELKEKIRSQVPVERVREYEVKWDNTHEKVTGLEQWGSLVLSDLWNAFEKETSQYRRQIQKDSIDRETWVIEQFIATRLRDYIGRDNILNKLYMFTSFEESSEINGIMITGEGGSGKSSLLAVLYQQLEFSKCVKLIHIAGISKHSTKVENMLRRWISELSAELNQEHTMDKYNSYEELRDIFTLKLLKLAEIKKIVIFIDALNEFEDKQSSKVMDWIPTIIHPNIRFIFTVNQNQNKDVLLLDSKKIVKQNLPPLSSTDVTEMINHICKRYRKELPNEVINILSTIKNKEGQYASGNPLWLQLALNRLFSLDEDDFSNLSSLEGEEDLKLKKLIIQTVKEIPGDISEVFGLLFQKTEKAFGVEWVSFVLRLLGNSRFGLRDKDLLELSKIMGQPWNDLDFALFRQYLNQHLVKRGELNLWTFYHEQARIAIKKRYLEDSRVRQQTHNLLASYLMSLPEHDSLKQSELMYHFLHARNKQESFLYFSRLNSEDELLVASEAITSFVNQFQDDGLKWFEDVLTLDDQSVIDFLQFCENIIKYTFPLINNELQISIRLSIYQSIKTKLESIVRNQNHFGEGAKLLSILYEKLGDLYQGLGDISQVKLFHEKSLKLRESFSEEAESLHTQAVSYDRLGGVYRIVGDSLKAKNSFLTALELKERAYNTNKLHLKTDRSIWMMYIHIGDVCLARAEYVEAIDYYEKALQVNSILRGEDKDSPVFARDLSITLNCLGHYYFAIGKLEKAKELYDCVYKIRYQLYSQLPDYIVYQRDMAIYYQSVGDYFLFASNSYDKAFDAYKKAHALHKLQYDKHVNHAEIIRDFAAIYSKIALVQSLKCNPNVEDSLAKGIELIDPLHSKDDQNFEYSFIYHQLQRIKNDNRNIQTQPTWLEMIPYKKLIEDPSLISYIPHHFIREDLRAHPPVIKIAVKGLDPSELTL